MASSTSIDSISSTNSGFPLAAERMRSRISGVSAGCPSRFSISASASGSESGSRWTLVALR